MPKPLKAKLGLQAGVNSARSTGRVYAGAGSPAAFPEPQGLLRRHRHGAVPAFTSLRVLRFSCPFPRAALSLRARGVVLRRASACPDLLGKNSSCTRAPGHGHAMLTLPLRTTCARFGSKLGPCNAAVSAGCR